jgi:photosystem II stability/assembly factor-like uncharacterized protein
MPAIRSLARLSSFLLVVTGCAQAQQSISAPATRVFRLEQVSGTNSLLIGVSAVNDKVVWVSGTKGAYSRTTDGGANWHSGRVPGADSLQFRDVYAVDANTAYLLSAGTGNLSRIYKTTDAGRTWTLQFTNSQPTAFYDCLDFWGPNHGIAASDAVDSQTVIITTSDGGAHWNPITPTSLPPAQLGEGSFAASGTCLITRPGGHAWIGTGSASKARVLHTRDYGRSWEADTTPIPSGPGIGIASLSFRTDQDGIALGGNLASAPTGAVTHDGGRTWTLITGPAFASGVYGGAYVPGTRRPTVVAVGPKGLAYSEDEGATWIAIDSMNYWSVAFVSRNAGWAVGDHGRITRLGGFP